MIKIFKNDDISSKECLNLILLTLQDNYYIIANEKLEHPKEIFNLHKKEKDEVLQNLIEKSSKISLWIIKNFPSLVESIEKWRVDGNYTEQALKIALRENTSFVYNRKEVNSLQMLEDYVLEDLNFFWDEYQNKKVFNDSFLPYLNDYLGCSYIRFLMNILLKIKNEDSKITEKIVIFVRDLLEKENNFIVYTQIFMPIVDLMIAKRILNEKELDSMFNNEEMIEKFNQYVNTKIAKNNEEETVETKKKVFFSRFIK